MPITRNQAKSLTSDKEFSLVESSYRDRVSQLNAAEVRRKARRAQRQLDRLSWLSERQRPGGTGRSNAAAKRGEEAPEVMARKIQLWTETVERFDERLGQLRSPRSVGAPSRSRSWGLREFFANRESNRIKRQKAEDTSALAADKRLQSLKSDQQVVSGHRNELNKQKQGKRDSRAQLR